MFCRDVADLATIQLKLPALRAALAKAEQAYGPAVGRDLAKAIDSLHHRHGWLERGMQAMVIDTPALPHYA